MKMTKLSEKLLKHMVTEYKKHETDMFSFEKFQELCQEESEKTISKALYHLEEKDFVSIYKSDDIPYMTTLLSTGIAYREEDTLLKKGYKTVKEIKSLLP
ncbi:lactate permease [Bacillus thuringiensis]|uniref:lactate permease n=2 Tax=Bacillus cereus group TaxID=86661 RepID=UPI000D0306FA|nr:lactate permease [Bacillus thuringiensis]MEB4814614.1 lactate permease [Bacillus thuringiensis]PRT09153.1 lactate permease [Bacillus thuringiensis]